MSPANGRPPSKNPKEHPFQMRLSQRDIEVLDRCKKTFGLSRSRALLYGLDLLDMATKNREFRQLVDAIEILKEYEDNADKYEQDEFRYLMDKQLSQIRFNFERFMSTYEK